MGFSRQAYWSRLPFPSPGDLSNPRIEPRSPALQTDSLPPEPHWPGRDPQCWLQLPLPNHAAFTPWWQPHVITGLPCTSVSPPKFRTVSKSPSAFSPQLSWWLFCEISPGRLCLSSCLSRLAPLRLLWVPGQEVEVLQVFYNRNFSDILFWFSPPHSLQ